MQRFKSFLSILGMAAAILVGINIQTASGVDCGSCSGYTIDNATNSTYYVILHTNCGDVGPITVAPQSSKQISSGGDCCIESVTEVTTGTTVQLFNYAQMSSGDYLRLTDGCYVLLSPNP